MDNAYWLWSFQGRILKRVALDKFCQLQWRPRPPTLLSAQQQKDIKKSLKKYSAQFEVKDRLKMSKASKVTFFFVFSISKYFLSQFLKFLVNLFVNELSSTILLLTSRLEYKFYSGNMKANRHRNFMKLVKQFIHLSTQLLILICIST